MNYIFIAYDKASQLKYKDSAKHETTSNGRIKSVIEGKLQAELTLIHKVESADKDLFKSFYLLNKNSLIDVVYGGISYTLNFSSSPIYTPLNGGMWKITVKFIGLI